MYYSLTPEGNVDRIQIVGETGNGEFVINKQGNLVAISMDNVYVDIKFKAALVVFGMKNVFLHGGEVFVRKNGEDCEAWDPMYDEDFDELFTLLDVSIISDEEHVTVIRGGYSAEFYYEEGHTLRYAEAYALCMFASKYGKNNEDSSTFYTIGAN